jgi:hypothetical protein
MSIATVSARWLYRKPRQSRKGVLGRRDRYRPTWRSNSHGCGARRRGRQKLICQDANFDSSWVVRKPRDRHPHPIMVARFDEYQGIDELRLHS